MQNGVDNSNVTTASNPTSVLSVFLVAALLACVIPPLVFAAVAMATGMTASDTLQALIEQYGSERQNLAVLGLVGLLPLTFMALTVWIVGRIKRITVPRRRLTIGGGVAILAVLIWVNLEYWPTFLPERTYAGFPHGLEFVIGPLVFTPIAMVVGMIVVTYIRK